MKVVVAGATGTIGRETVRMLCGQGHSVRTLSRDPARAASLREIAAEVRTGDATCLAEIESVCDGVDAVISSLGAPVNLGGGGRRSFAEVDTAANRNIILCAKRAGVPRFIYVAAHVVPVCANTAYIRAHEAVAQSLAESELSYTVVRPTGLFPVFLPMLDAARFGFLAIPGDGKARTNPIHPADVAALCVEALDAGAPRSIPAGGPDVLTREEIAILALRARNRRPRVIHTPARSFQFAGALLRPFDRRLSEVMEFAERVFTNDCVAPAIGRRRLEDYFRATAEK